MLEDGSHFTLDRFGTVEDVNKILTPALNVYATADSIKTSLEESLIRLENAPVVTAEEISENENLKEAVKEQIGNLAIKIVDVEADIRELEAIKSTIEEIDSLI